MTTSPKPVKHSDLPELAALLHSAASEAVDCFEGMASFGELTPTEANAELPVVHELTTSFSVVTEAAPGEQFALITLTVRSDGKWLFLGESAQYIMSFETSGAIATPKDPLKAQAFIEGLNLTYDYTPFEQPSALEAELAAAFAGFLKRFTSALKRGAARREGATSSHAEQLPPIIEPPSMTTEELLQGLKANDALLRLFER